MICPRSAILHSAAASIVAGIFELTVSTAARIATFGRSRPSEMREVDRVLADVDLVLERRRDVDRRVGDDQHLVIGRHVHDEDVADAAAGAQPGLARDDRAEQLVGVQAALHQQLGLALPHQLHRLGRRRRGCAARRRSAICPRSMPAGLRDLLDLRRRADEDRHDQPLLGGLDRAGQRRSPRTGARPPSAPARGCGTARAAVRTFRFQLSAFMIASRAAAGPASRRGPGLLQEKREDDRQRRRRRAAARTPSGSARASSRGAAATRHAGAQPNTGPSSALNVKFRKLTTPVAVPLISRRVGFLDHRVGQHRRARGDARRRGRGRTAEARRRGRRGSRRGRRAAPRRRRRSPACAGRSGPRRSRAAGSR